MASNLNRKSVSSGNRPRRSTVNTRRTVAPTGVQSVRVGDIRNRQHYERAQKKYRNYIIRLGVLAGFIVALIIAGIIVYNSAAFTIENVDVKGADHLTSTDIDALVQIDEGTTLLRVDTGAIRDSLLRDAWVADVSVNRVFPSTLEISITEREITAVVEVPSGTSNTTNAWAIASDGMWLMPIPERDSDAGKYTSEKVYQDAESVLHITDVPIGTKPKIGTYCTDANVNCALSIVYGMTTELAQKVTSVKATETESTTLTIKDGPDIVFGDATNIREKERLCLKIMSEHPDGVTYINVRTPEKPTWRAL